MVVVGLLWAQRNARAQDDVVKLEPGITQIRTTPFAIDRIVVGDATIVDVISLTGYRLLFTAKGIGETHVTLISRTGKSRTFRVRASPPISVLKEALFLAHPGEEFEVHALSDAVFVGGLVSSVTVADDAIRIANAVFGGGKGASIVNLMQVSGIQQVQLRLKFVEVSRTALRAIGAGIWYQDDKTIGAIPVLNSSGSPSVVDANASAGLVPLAANLPILNVPISGSFALMFARTGLVPISATLAVLQGHGLAKTLSEPTLVTMSGREAEFLVGGEFPIQVPDALGRTSIEFKDFGVKLKFLPTVIDHDTIQLTLTAEVSSLDSSAGVVTAGVSVPGLKSRQASTSVRLQDGQSFAVAGLLSDTMSNTTRKIPLLGDIPIIGALFRSVEYRREETELVMLATVNLVKPLAAGAVPELPGEDEFSDPGDLRLFLFGTIDAGEKKSSATPRIDGRLMTSYESSPLGAIGFMR